MRLQGERDGVGGEVARGNKGKESVEDEAGQAAWHRGAGVRCWGR